MLLNKNIFIILLVLFAVNVFAQRETPLNLRNYDRKVLRFGYTLGYTTMDFNIRQSSSFYTADTVFSIENKRFPGFHLGIVSELHILSTMQESNFDLRFLPGLSFGERDMKYLIYNSKKQTFDVHVMQIESTFLDFPLLLKYSSKRLNNYRAYVIGGASMRYDLAAQREINPEEKPKIRLKPMDYYYELGFGLDYFLEYFKFSTEIKLAVGMTDVLVPDNTEFTNTIDRMNSKLIVISLHFEGGKWDTMSNFMGKIMWWKSV